MSNITEVTFTTGRYAVTEPLYQYDYGQVLKITAPSLPDPYTVHFGNARSSGESLTVLGTASDGAAIPSALLATGLNVYAWVFLHTGENDGETEYMIEIPVIRRAEPTDDPVIEEDPSAVDIIMGEISSLKEDIENISGTPTNVRQAIKTLFDNALYKDVDVDDELATIAAWAEEVTSITLDKSSASISGSGTVVIIATTVPTGASVTWASSNTAVATVSNGVVTSVGNGTCTITATSGNVSAMCEVAVSGLVTLDSISAVYTPSDLVFTTDSIDILKSDIVVTAHYSDETTETIDSANYTLSGTLTDGTSTITIVYQDKTTTISVPVIGATDVTPALTSFVKGPYNNISVNSEAHTLRIWNTSARGYQGTYAPFTVESGYTYRVTCDAAVTSGIAKVAFANSAGSISGAEYSSDNYSESTHIKIDSPYLSTNERFYMYCTWASAIGDVTYSNLKIIKYIAVE